MSKTKTKKSRNIKTLSCLRNYRVPLSAELLALQEAAKNYINWLQSSDWFNSNSKSNQIELLNSANDILEAIYTRQGSYMWATVTDHWHECPWDSDDWPECFADLYEGIDTYRTEQGYDSTEDEFNR